LPDKERYERYKLSGVCTACGANPVEVGTIKCTACVEYKRKRQQTPQYREYHREYKNRLYGIYCCYMPQLDQFKLGYGGVYNRLSVYRVTDPNTTIVAYTELDKKTAKREERKILRETIIYNSNGSKQSEMRLNCAPVRKYIKDNFDVIKDETILNIRAQKRIVQAKL